MRNRRDSVTLRHDKCTGPCVYESWRLCMEVSDGFSLGVRLWGGL